MASYFGEGTFTKKSREKGPLYKIKGKEISAVNCL
jgi:hypothetical protein